MAEQIVGTDKDCLGCGSDLFSQAGNRSIWRGAKVRVGRTKTAYVCCGRSEGRPSKVCEVKAREKAALCPGCDAEQTKLGTVCLRCEEAIERDGTAQARTGLEWWGIAGKKIGPSLHFEAPNTRRGYVYPTEELAALLAQAMVAGRGPVGRDKLTRYVDPDRYVPSSYETHHDDVQFIEITPEAGAALKKLVAKFMEIMRLQYGDGFRDGSDALGRLSIGDTTVQDFERYKAEVERRHGRRPDGEDQG